MAVHTLQKKATPRTLLVQAAIIVGDTLSNKQYTYPLTGRVNISNPPRLARHSGREKYPLHEKPILYICKPPISLMRKAPLFIIIYCLFRPQAFIQHYWWKRI